MFRKFTTRLFTIIFLPLVACQLPGGQASQPAELPTLVPTALPTAEPTAVPTALPTAEPTAVPTATPATEPLPATEVPLCESLYAGDKQARYTSGQVVGDYSHSARWPSDNAEIVIVNQLEEVSKVQPYVSEQTFELLKNTDFTNYFVVLTFEGKGKNLLAPIPDSIFCISQWSHNERDVTVSLQLYEQFIVPADVRYEYGYFQV